MDSFWSLSNFLQHSSSFKEDVVHIHNEYYSAIKNNEISAVTGMDLEIIILNEVCQRQISYDITYIWDLKKGYK